MFFSAPPSRWTILIEKIKITIKGQSTTRWSARAKAVNALHYQYLAIVEVLTDMITTRASELNSETLAGATSLFSQIVQFKFLLSVI